jgi:hypothetical protein
VRRTVLYLGEINDEQQASWRKTRAVFDEQKFMGVSLLSDDRTLPGRCHGAVQVKLSGLELRRQRPFGNCWLALQPEA